jgi:flavin-dependent dehydrogenase
MVESADEFDVVVIGGGPGGSAAAGLLAMRGHRVLVLEREKFPRYHIGESLITGGLPVLETLDLRGRLDAAGFTRKYGGTLVWGAEETSVPRGWRALGPSGGADRRRWGFRFTQASHYEYSYQVRRADFDAILLGRARELGAYVIEEATVREPLFEAGRAVGVTYQRRGEEGDRTVRCRLLLDASGQSHLLARHLGLVEWHEDLRNIAVWAYFQGCRRYPGDQAGDILTESCPPGWFWFIPLHDGTVSLGYVTPIADFRRSGLSLEALHGYQMGRSEEVRALAGDAVRVSGFRTIKDWSYTCSRFHGPGWALVGDAAAFIDPLLSTGVTLALRAADGVAEAADRALREPAEEVAAMEGYEKSYREFLESLLSFVRYFYHRDRPRTEYWDRAQQTIDPARRHPAETDFATMLSGLTGLKAIFPDARR